MSEQPFRLAGTREEDCPRCGARVVHDIRFVPWCGACEWNVTAGFPGADTGGWARALAASAGAALFAELQRRPAATPPRVTVARAGAIGISIAVIAFALFVLVLGVRILVTPPFQPSSLFGLVLIAFAVAARPQIHRVPEHLVDEAAAPELRRLVADVASTVGAPMPRLLAFDAQWNAWTARVGWRQRRILVLGMPLWSSLGPQERVALLAHELAHGRNGDPTRGVLVSVAVGTLANWYDVLLPEAIVPRTGTVTAIVVAFFNLLLTLVAEGVRLLLEGLLLLLYRDTQRAEYYADRLAASAAGTGAAIGTLLRARDLPAWERALTVTAREAGRVDLWTEIDTQIALTSPNEQERLRRAELRLGNGLRDTHPTTAHRVAILAAAEAAEAPEAAEPRPPAFVLDPERNARIEAELVGERRRLAKVALERYEERRWGF